MEIANIVLEYIKALIDWPLIVFALAWMFREPISEFLKKLRKVGFPGGSLDAEADEASSEVDQVAVASPEIADSPEVAEREESPIASSGETVDDVTQRQPDIPAAVQPPVVAPGEAGSGESDERDEEVRSKMVANRDVLERRKTLDEGQYYESYRQLALTSPEEAVREAYQRVRLAGRRLLQDTVLTDQGQGSKGMSVRPGLTGIVEALAEQKLINPDAREPARRLDRIYMSERPHELSARGALSFIDAAQKLDRILTDTRRYFSHQRRLTMRKIMPTVEGLLADFGLRPPAVRLTPLTNALLIRFSAPTPDAGSDPRYAALMSELRELGRQTSVPIRIRHSDSERSLLLNGRP